MAEKFQWTNNRNQYYAAIAGGLIPLSHGSMVGWISPALAILTSKDSPLSSGPLTTEQLSWVGSLGAVGILFGSFLFGFITSIFGCKRTTLSLAIPAILVWILISFGNDYVHILCVTFTIGTIAGGFPSTTVLFIAEIANDDIRGRLGSITFLFKNVGIISGYILGSYVDFKLVPCISVIIPILFAIIFSTFPNTPQYYLAKGKLREAEVALKYYKGFEGISSQEETAISNDFARLVLIVNRRNAEIRLRAADICNRDAIKGFGISIALIVFAQCTANYAITNYAVQIFQKSGASINPNLSSIILSLTYIPGSLLPTCLSDILGRKVLNFISLIGSAFGLFSVALYRYLKINGFDMSLYDWVPLVSMSFVSLISSGGICTLSIVCSLEQFTSRIRNFGMVIVGVSLSIAAFASFPILMEALELYGVLMIYGTGCVIGAIFVLFVLKETSGQPLDDDINSSTNLDEILLTNGECQRPLNSMNEFAFRYHTFSECNKSYIIQTQ